MNLLFVHTKLLTSIYIIPSQLWGFHDYVLALVTDFLEYLLELYSISLS